MKSSRTKGERHLPGLFRKSDKPGLFLLRFAAFLLTALLQPLIAAPFGLWFLHWVAWIPFLWAIHAQNGKRNLLLSFIGGTVSNGLIFYWVIKLLPNFTNISMSVSIILVFLLCGYLSLVWVVLAWLIPKFSHRFPETWIWMAPPLLVALEFIFPQLFPYMQGVSHYQVIPIIQLSSVTGVYGVSFLIFLANCVLFRLIRGFRDERKIIFKPLFILFLILASVLLYGYSRMSLYQSYRSSGKILKTGLIQANLTPEKVQAIGFDQVWKIYRELSREAVEKGSDWIVWSEGEFLIPLDTPAAEISLTNLSRKLGCPVLLGGYGEKIVGNRYVSLNSAIHVDPDTGMGQRYDKQILVPFGEYMPFEEYLSFIYSKINWTSRFYPGSESVVQPLQGIPYGFLICYEAIYPSLARKAVRRGARLLVNITYDGWFGRTSAPYQHLMLAAIRSAENGIPMVRLSATGITTTVDALGRMKPLSTLYKRQVLVHPVTMVHLPSVYSRIGDVFAWLCLVLIVLVVVFRLKILKINQKSRKADQG